MAYFFVPLKETMKRYKIKLLEDEVNELLAIVGKGAHTSHAFRTAYILLNCDEGEYASKATNEQISKVLRVSPRTIERAKKRFLEEGLEAALERRPTTRKYQIKLDGDVESKLVKLCCSDPPDGYARWSLRLLADQMVDLNYVESISYVSVGNMLKKMNLSLGKQRGG